MKRDKSEEARQRENARNFRATRDKSPIKGRDKSPLNRSRTSIADKSFDNTSRDMRKSYDLNLGKSAKKTRDVSNDRNLNKSATRNKTPTRTRDGSKSKTPRRELSKSALRDKRSNGSRDKSPLKTTTKKMRPSSTIS